MLVQLVRRVSYSKRTQEQIISYIFHVLLGMVQICSTCYEKHSSRAEGVQQSSIVVSSAAEKVIEYYKNLRYLVQVPF